MDYRNHMGFIYSGPIPDLRCHVCDKVLAFFTRKECSPGRIMHKDKEMEQLIPIFGKHPVIERKTAIVCPKHQAKLEDEGYYLASWWGKDGMVHGTK